MINSRIANGARKYLVQREFPYDRCILGYTEIIIRANGDLHPGCYELGPTGNILDQSLLEILTADASGTTTRSMFNLQCSKCLIGWQTSMVFERPLANIGYALKRLRTKQTASAN